MQVTLCNSLLFFLVQDVHPCSVCSYSTRVVLVLLYPPPRRQSPKDEKQENVQLGFTLQFNTIKNPSQSLECSWRKLRPFSGLNSIFDVLFPKRERVFHRGIQTPRNKWKHEAAGRVLLLFRGVWIPRWNTRSRFGNNFSRSLSNKS